MGAGSACLTDQQHCVLHAFRFPAVGKARVPQQLELVRHGQRGIEMDELYKKALQIVIDEQKASMSLLQRKLGVGYNKAGMLIERMEEENYIEEFKGGASRKVLITQAQFDERFHG